MLGTQYEETCVAPTEVILPDIGEFRLPKSEDLSEHATRAKHIPLVASFRLAAS